MGDYSKSELLPGIFFAAFLAGACGMGGYYLPGAMHGAGSPLSGDILRGKWAPKFEKAFGDALPVGTQSRDGWGLAEYEAFGQGRKGVVVGREGWLYTAEEFSCPVDAEDNLKQNLSYIADKVKGFTAKNIRTIVALIPAKARALPEHLNGAALPGCRRDLYQNARNTLLQQGVPVADVLGAMQSQIARDDLYLKTDTHWTQEGARVAAKQVAAAAHTFNNLDLPPGTFESEPTAAGKRDGDLARYLPGAGVAPEPFKAWKTSATVSVAGTGSMQDLLGDAPAPAVTLVGTSYSANPSWNFDGFLKEALKSDVLNMAEEGQGPLVVMDKYLAGNGIKDSPPKLLVWEIPERYLVMPHGVAPQ